MRLNILIKKLYTVMIHIFFGEFYHFNTTIIGVLEKYFKSFPDNIINIITLYDYAFILKKHFGNNINLVIPQEENELYISYRRMFSGNPNTGFKDNFKLIKKYGNITPKSNLIETNSWFDNCDYLMKWCKDNNYPSEGYNFLGYKIESNENPKFGWSYYTYLKKKFKNTPWIDTVDDKKNDIYCLYDNLIKPLLKDSSNNSKLYNIEKKIYIENKGSNDIYINVFPRFREGQWKKDTHCSFIPPIFWKKLLSRINIEFPTLKIVIHGHQESCRNLLIEYKNIIFTNSIKDSIKFLSNSKLLITPISGFGRLAMNCGIKNLIEILQPKSTHTIENFKPKKHSIYGHHDFNPFGSNVYSIKYNNLNVLFSILENIINK
jgi:hypothetical protein